MVFHFINMDTLWFIVKIQDQGIYTIVIWKKLSLDTCIYPSSHPPSSKIHVITSQENESWPKTGFGCKGNADKCHWKLIEGPP